jgi:hypothetical protein
MCEFMQRKEEEIGDSKYKLPNSELKTALMLFFDFQNVL